MKTGLGKIISDIQNTLPPRLRSLGALLLHLLVFIVTGILVLPTTGVLAAVEFSSSLNPVGSGARATGMGGAFIAVADDATAASWNPAGLINLEKPELSIVYSYFNRSQTYNSATHPEVTGTSQSMDANDINYASIAYPFALFDHNMIVTLNYQRLYDMTKRSAFPLFSDLGDGDFRRTNVNFSQDGYLGAFSPAFAIQVSPELYFGATLNIWNDFAGTSHWQSTLNRPANGTVSGLPFTETNYTSSKFTLSGLNAHFGVLYSPGSNFTFGFVFKTPFTADVTMETNFASSQSFPDAPFLDASSNSDTKEDLKMSMPASYGAGIAYRHSDSLTLAFDLYRTDWSEFALTDSAGIEYNPITTLLLSEGKCKDTTQVRLGGEYLFIGDKTVVPVRGGLFYDPEPNGTRLDDFYGFSLGTGLAYGKYIFDVSYQYRFGNGVASDIPNSGVTSDISQHTAMMSLIYHFK